jgi:hypothetical protein
MVKPDRPLATTVLAFVFAGVALFMEGCNGAAGPDLVAERRTGGTGAEGFCRRDDAGNLVVRVRNQSNADVLVQTTTVVVFSPGGPRTGTTAPMPRGSFADVTLPIPAECFNADCDFTITVDSDEAVDESDEDNNTADGICVG